VDSHTAFTSRDGKSREIRFRFPDTGVPSLTANVISAANSVSSSARLHPSTETSLVLCWREQPFRRRPFSPSRERRALSYPCFHLPRIPWGITRPSVHHVSLPRLATPSPLPPPQPSARSLAVGALPSTTILPRLPTSRGWASELVQIPMRPREQRKPITDSSCAIS